MHHLSSDENGSKARCCRHRHHSHGCGKTIFVLGLAIGSAYGVLFAQTSGAELRKKLSKSKSPVQDFIKICFDTKMDFFHYVHKRATDLLNGK